MRIYNKKKFSSGGSCIVLSALILITAVLQQNIDISRWVLAFALLVIGGSEIIRSLSKRMTKEDRLDELDERNSLIAWKSKSRAFELTQSISFILMLALLVMGKVSGYVGFIYMGVGLAFAFPISFFAEIFAYLYYEVKN